MMVPMQLTTIRLYIFLGWFRWIDIQLVIIFISAQRQIEEGISLRVQDLTALPLWATGRRTRPARIQGVRNGPDNAPAAYSRLDRTKPRRIAVADLD